MNDLVFTILSSLTFSGLLTGAIVFLSKNWIAERLKNAIKHEYDQKLETHKAQLKAVSDVELEHLRSRLHVAASERSIRLSKIFEETAETVAATYAKLIALSDAVASYVNVATWEGEPSKAEKRKFVGEKYQEFLDYFRPRRLFIPKDTAKRIDEFHRKLAEMTREFFWKVEKEDGGKRGDLDVWMKTHETMQQEVPQLLDLLEDDFRRALGTIEQGQIG